MLLGLLRVFPRSAFSFAKAVRSQLGGKLWILDRIADALDIERRRVTHRSHHESHAASAFLVSPFDEAAVIVVDAVGEHDSTTIWSGKQAALTAVASQEFPHSVGIFLAAITALLGFRVNEGEYKLMALAAVGKPRFRDDLEKVMSVGADGSIDVRGRYFTRHRGAELGFSADLETLLGGQRSSERPWDLNSSEDRRWADIAASAQHLTEEAMLAIAVRARKLTGHDKLCIAGGVGLNAVANARIAAESGFDGVFVQPAAGDAGGALGAALLGAIERGDPRPAPMTDCALGPSVDPGRASAIATAAGLTPRRSADPVSEIAASVAAGQNHCARHGKNGVGAAGARPALDFGIAAAPRVC